MSEPPPFDDVSMYAETHARCIAAQDRASEALRRAAIALKNAEDRLRRAQAARAAAIRAREYATQNNAVEYAARQVNDGAASGDLAGADGI